MKEAYGVFGERGEDIGEGHYLVDHSAFTYLMGPDGGFVALFPRGFDPQGVAASIARLMMKMTVRLGAVLLAFLLVACGGEDGGGNAGSIYVTEAWARETMPDQVSAVAYFTVANDGPIDRLVALEADIADRAIAAFKRNR